jgi:hypothetical protein
MQNKTPIKLSSGRTVAFRPYLSNGVPNGAIDAYIVESIDGAMTDEEWNEYCKLTMPKPKPKLTWEQIKKMKAA